MQLDQGIVKDGLATVITGNVNVLEDNKEIRIAESGVYTYIGKAEIASASNSAVWQIKRLDETSGLIMLWADGNDNYDNVWDNYLTLSYS